MEDSPEVQTFRSGNIEIISTGMIERRVMFLIKIDEMHYAYF